MKPDKTKQTESNAINILDPRPVEQWFGVQVQFYKITYAPHILYKNYRKYQCVGALLFCQFEAIVGGASYP